jgi:hypothetical protein
MCAAMRRRKHSDRSTPRTDAAASSHSTIDWSSFTVTDCRPEGAGGLMTSYDSRSARRSGLRFPVSGLAWSRGYAAPLARGGGRSSACRRRWRLASGRSAPTRRKRGRRKRWPLLLRRTRRLSPSAELRSGRVSSLLGSLLRLGGCGHCQLAPAAAMRSSSVSSGCPRTTSRP